MIPACKSIRAPGKLILSGEHAVVYGKPALAMAVNRYVFMKLKSQAEEIISLDLPDLFCQSDLTLSGLAKFKNQIKKKYHRFIGGELAIQHVLNNPVELPQFALSLCVDILKAHSGGIEIYLKSDIPMGCGMGSSAATIISILYGIADYVGVHLPLNLFYDQAIEAENMQHGFSSGLDLRVSLHGGSLYLKEKEFYFRNIPDFPFYLIHTGVPKTSTGECISTVRHHFEKTAIGEDFEKITNALDLFLQSSSQKINYYPTEIIKIIRENHKLLVNIGVVPEPVQDFIKLIENNGGAAKISGAGAVAGRCAGVVLACIDDVQKLKQISKQYHYTILPITGESRGVHGI